jgi:ABC-2 type transport system ATP-binding protein
VLHGLDLSVPVGAVVGLLGPSGCGKSTLMRAIVGVQRVAGGEVDVLGLPAGSAALRSEVGYVTQAPSVYADLTVRQNLTYFARVMGAPPDDPGRVLANVGLNSAAEQLVGSLSGGQRARVSLATALLGHPRLLILDEPTVGLDPLLRRELWQRFRSLADSGVTLLVSSHVMDEAAHCDRLLLLRDGQLLADTEPDALLERTGADNLENAFLRLLEQQDTTMEVVA